MAAGMILTGQRGNNSDLFPNILALYVTEGSLIADVTYGRGVFWANVDVSRYELKKSDLQDGIDARHLPYPPQYLDAIVIDPPYMHGGATVKASINKCYKNENGSHESVIRLYGAMILEAARVLKQKGVAIIKCQDEIESGQQRLSHIEITTLLEIFGFAILDIFVLLQTTRPVMRETYQKTARKNHSYFIVAKFRR